MPPPAGGFPPNQSLAARGMGSHDLEREKGITILAKNTAVQYQGHQSNIIDTPGHADFGGEVERGLRLVDGVLLLVDAAEGPLPQTRFVLSKALGMGLKTVLVINKIDRQDARPREVLDQVYSLYIDLGADESQIDFPVLYAVARQGQASTSLPQPGQDLRPLFESILSHIPPPPAPAQGEDSLRLLVANLDYDDYVGRLALARLHSGRIASGAQLAVVREGGKVEQGKVLKLYGFSGLKRVEIADAGP